MEGMGVATGTIVFCVQDDPTVNFNGVFVNFGNVQINTATTGDNTINDNDQVNDGDANATTSAAANTTTDPNATATTSAAATTTSEASAATTTSVATTNAPNTGGSMETIQVSDVECSRLEADGNFDFDMNGQKNFETGDGENPGRGDEARGRSDSPCDHDQGFGNDWKCENGRASKDIEVEAGDVNLLDYQQGRAAFLARAEVPPMTIEDACVTIDDVRVTLNEGGDDREVEIQATEVCIDGPIEVREGHQTLAVLKVDLEQSLREEGDRVIFNPVVHIRAAAPVTQTITIHETVTETVTATSEATNETNGTTMTTSTSATYGTNETSTASPTATSSPTSSPTSGP